MGKTCSYVTCITDDSFVYMYIELNKHSVLFCVYMFFLSDRTERNGNLKCFSCFAFVLPGEVMAVH